MQIEKSNKPINLILCLAGKGQRFIDKGYNTPKFLLKNSSDTETILELIIKNFYISKVNNFILILNKNHKIWAAEIDQTISKFKDCNFDILFIDDTEGQAETAFHGAMYIKENASTNSLDPISFHNGDTILFKRNLAPFLGDLKNFADGAIDTFPASSNAYSYITTSPSGWISAIKEKKVISNMATSGFYIFKDCETFLSFYKETIFFNKEKYISDVYQTMLAKNSRILNLYNKNNDDTLILGTPDEYEHWKRNG